MTRQIAAGANARLPGVRKTEKRLFKMFYNPMWRHYGQTNGTASGSHYGTFYYDNSGRENLYWHMLDQVLLRSQLLPIFDDYSLEIITQVQGVSLLDSNGVPDKERFSDHLPILFELSI